MILKYRKIMKQMCVLLLLGGLLLLTGCKNKTVKPAMQEAVQTVTTGDDRDEHGCRTSAGYTWSEVRNECIRIFEKGTRLNNKVDTLSPLSAFIVFSPDSSQVELFMPTDPTKAVLDRRRAQKGYVWNIEDDDTFLVRQVDGKWQIERRMRLLFSE